MKLLITIEELEKLTNKDLAPLECLGCHVIFHRNPSEVKRGLKGIRNVSYCSQRCAWDNYPYRRSKKEYRLICEWCKSEFVRIYSPSDYKRHQHRKKFCSRKCTCRYIRVNTNGQGRSKLEKWLEVRLNELYPKLEILYNNRKTINSELDIFIPSMRLAFELNGIFHYEAIFNEEQLSKIQTNDSRKFQACIDNNIELCIIDVSEMRNFVKRKAENFLSVIVQIINGKLERLPR